MNKRKIIISTLTGTIALAALSISLSLAWYGANDRLNVENLEVGVSGKGNLKISFSSERDTFVEGIVDEEKIEFSPVSSMYKNTWIDAKAEKPVFYESAYKHVLSSGEPYLEQAEFGFYCKDVYLLTDVRNQFAVLDFDEEKGSKISRDDLIDSEKNFERAQKLHDEYPEWGFGTLMSRAIKLRHFYSLLVQLSFGTRTLVINRVLFIDGEITQLSIVEDQI